MNPDQAKQALQALRDELTGRVARTHKHIHERDERVSADYDEQSVEMENQALVMSLDAEGREELRMIDSALARIDEGTFGHCMECGQNINAQRLQALPHAALCINCAREEEN